MVFLENVLITRYLIYRSPRYFGQYHTSTSSSKLSLTAFTLVSPDLHSKIWLVLPRNLVLLSFILKNNNMHLVVKWWVLEVILKPKPYHTKLHA